MILSPHPQPTQCEPECQSGSNQILLGESAKWQTYSVSYKPAKCDRYKHWSGRMRSLSADFNVPRVLIAHNASLKIVALRRSLNNITFASGSHTGRNRSLFVFGEIKVFLKSILVGKGGF